MEDLIGALEVDAVVEEEMHAQQEEMELQRNFLWLERPTNWTGTAWSLSLTMTTTRIERIRSA